MFFRVAQLTPYIAMPGFRFEEAHRVGAHHERLPISGFQSVCTTQSQVLRLRLDPSSITSSTDLQSFLLLVSSLLEDKVRYSVFHRIQYGMQTALSAVQRADPWRTAACSCFPLRRVFLTMLQLVLHIQPEVLWHQHTVCIRVRIPPVGRYLFVVVIIYAMML